MGISFAGLPTASYQGTIFSQPVKVGNQSARVVPLSFNWQAYGGGANLPNIVVPLNIQNTGQSKTLDQIRSIYIDNINGAVPVYVQFNDNNYTITAEPFSSGWYPVLSNVQSFVVAILGLTNTNLTTTYIYVSNVATAPYTDIAQQFVVEQRLATPFLPGSTGGLLAITPLVEGSCYNNGNLTISGGGGSGAAAQGVLNQYGQFTSVTLTNPGTGYTGQPIITPTGGQTAFPNFNPGATYSNGNAFTYQGYIWIWNSGIYSINTGAPFWSSSVIYNVGSQVDYGNNIYQAINKAASAGVPPTNTFYWALVGSVSPVYGNPAGAGGNWLSTGIPSLQTATFTATLGTISQPITNSGFGIAAMGDQISSGNFSTAALGVVVNNLFGSPYANGFIYLTSIFAAPAVSAAGANPFFNLLQTAGGLVVLGPFQWEANSANSPEGTPLIQLSNCNVKLDATQTWQIKITTAATGFVNYGFTWTYANR